MRQVLAHAAHAVLAVLEQVAEALLVVFGVDDLAVREIVQATYRRTLALLKAREALLRTSAADLLARETLGEAELASIRVAAVAETVTGG